MKLALLSEIGARAIYNHLGRHAHDEDLKSMLGKLNQEGAEVVVRLQDLIRGLGGRPRRTSFRRRAMARILALASRMIGMRPVLRVCLNAEETVERWYGEYCLFLMRLGDRERARTCTELAEIKHLHAQALSAWIQNLRGR